MNAFTPNRQITQILPGDPFDPHKTCSLHIFSCFTRISAHLSICLTHSYAYIRMFWRQYRSIPWFGRCFWRQYRSIPWFGQCFWRQHRSILWCLRCFFATVSQYPMVWDNVFIIRQRCFLEEKWEVYRGTQCFLNVFFGPGIKTQRLIDQIHVLLPELIELMNWLNWIELKQGLHLHGFSALLCAALFLQLLCLS